MPELPDIAAYLESLEARILGQVLQNILLADVFVLRTVTPSIDSLVGQRVTGLRRLGKRVVLGFENGSFLVIHLISRATVSLRSNRPRPARIPGGQIGPN